MTPIQRLRQAFLLPAAACAALAVAPAAKAEGPWALTGFAGVMTDDVWEDAILFWQADYLRSGLVGVGLGRDIGRYGKLSFEVEVQAVQHFGRQDNLEFNAPLILRYNREASVLPALQSLAFGFGLSWASEKPQTEIDRDGDTTQTLFYWMAELAFDLPDTDVEFLARIHHRSDGYGFWPVDSGSNALAIGLRKRF